MPWPRLGRSCSPQRDNLRCGKREGRKDKTFPPLFIFELFLFILSRIFFSPPLFLSSILLLFVYMLLLFLLLFLLSPFHFFFFFLRFLFSIFLFLSSILLLFVYILLLFLLLRFGHSLLVMWLLYLEQILFGLVLLVLALALGLAPVVALAPRWRRWRWW